MTFVRNHAKAIVACDFFFVTANFRTLYVFVVMELGTRRILHHNVTDHPTAEWTMQQFREALPDDCLDFLIPLNERHLKLTLKSWVRHFNQGRPHMSLGPGIPVPPPHPPPAKESHHVIPAGHVIRSTAVLGGLHHEYALEKTAA